MTTTTLTQQFAAEYAKGAVPAMLKAIKRVKLSTSLVLTLGLSATYGHQGAFLSSIRGLALFGWILPAVFDLGMIAMMVQAQTAGMNALAKSRAMKVFAGLVATSTLVNVLASHGWTERIVFAAVVVLVGAIKWAASAIGPDFAAMETVETSIAVDRPSRKLDPAEAARRAAKARDTKARNKAAAMTPQQRAAETRKANQLARELSAMADGYSPADAPVSPAIA